MGYQEYKYQDAFINDGSDIESGAIDGGMDDLVIYVKVVDLSCCSDRFLDSGEDDYGISGEVGDSSVLEMRPGQMFC